MSTNNPYAFDDDVDADLFVGPAAQADSAKEELVNSAIDKLIAEVGEPMSPEDRQQFTRILMGMPDDLLQNVDILVAAVNNNFNVVERFSEFSQVIETLNPHAPLLRAMFDVLNEMTNGAIERRWRVYRHEHLLAASHYALKGLNNMAEHASTDGLPEMLQNLLQSMVQSTLDRIFSLSEEYRVIAEAEGFPVDEALITNGTFTPGRFSESMEFTVNTVFEVAVHHLHAGN